MEPISGFEIAEATGGSVIAGNAAMNINQITTDSRSVPQNSLFIPLVGERFDGHRFLSAACQAGAAAVLTQEDEAFPADTLVIRVADTGAALLNLARYYRRKFPVPVVGITGSVGKTTTKDMIASVLEEQFNTLKTQGNFNNEIGLPLTMFRMDSETEIAVVEMGMSALGEIDRLSSVAEPDTAVITNIGMSHIETLGSQENILKAKLEILNHMKPGGLVVLNGDDPFLWSVRSRIKHAVYAGIHNRECEITAADVQLGAESLSFTLSVGGEQTEIRLGLPGEHNVYNAMIAAAVGMHYHIPMERITLGLEKFTPTGMRMEIFKTGRFTVVNDCYNAQPASMKAALGVLAGMSAKRHVAVLGDMLEMGRFAQEAHRGVGGDVAQNKIDLLITVGEHGRLIGEGAAERGMDRSRIYSFDTNEKALEALKGLLEAEDAVLVKASRGMHFEQLVEGLR